MTALLTGRDIPSYMKNYRDDSLGRHERIRVTDSIDALFVNAVVVLQWFSKFLTRTNRLLLPAVGSPDSHLVIDLTRGLAIIRRGKGGAGIGHVEAY